MTEINKTNTSTITGYIKIDKIRQFMQERNLTETQFAEKCHIDKKELNKVLDNYSLFEPITLLRISRYMGIEFSDLVRDKKKL